MTSLHATHIHLRRLLALLTVVAAFVFQVRMGSVADLAMSGGAVMVRGMAPAGHGQTAPAPHSAQHQHSQEPRGQGQGGQGQGNSESHNHAAHCPFCVTGAFALEAGVLPMPTAPPHLAAQLQHFAPFHLPAAVRHADARAPPVLL